MHHRLLSTALVLAGLVACSGNNPYSVFPRVDVTVTGAGTGSGSVVAPDPTVQINCQVLNGATQSGCHSNFPDAGGGGVFTLDATPAAGSTFVGWTGCNSVAGPVCTLTFQPGDTTFAIQARFDLLALTGVNLLANPGFESAVAVGTLPSVTGLWRGDSAYAVVTDQGIVPKSGAQMLRFMRSGLLAGAGIVSSQQWQLIDVSGLATAIDAGKIQVDAYSWFNRVTGDVETDTRFDLRVLTFTGTPSTFPTDYATPGSVSSDTVLTTGNLWEQASVTTTLPVGTRYLAVEIYAFENVMDDATDPEFDGHYADDLSLVLTQLP